MKCFSCQGEWTPPNNVSLSKCPFCGTDILQMLNKQVEDLTPEVILRNMIKVYGIELLQNEQRLSAMIADLFAHDRKTKKLLLLSVKEKVPQQILKLKNDSQRMARLNAIQLYLMEEALLKEEIAKQMMSMWTEVFSSSIFAQENHPKPAPIEIKQDPPELLDIISEHGKFGFQNSKGEKIIPCKYEKVEAGYSFMSSDPFYKGMVKVCLNGKYGYIDKTGNEIITLKYDRIGDWSSSTSDDDLIPVELNKKCGFINKNGDIIIPLKYDDIGGSDNIFMRPTSQLPWNKCFHKTDLRVVGLKFDGIIKFDRIINNSYDNEHNYGISPNKYGIINILGKEVVPLIYNQINLFRDGLACVQRAIINAEYGLMRVGFKESIESTMKVVATLKWGFINEKGIEVIRTKFDFAGNFNEGLAKVKLNNKWGYIDKTGNEVIPLKYSSIGDPLGRIEDFKEGLVQVEYAGKYGLIDKTGNVIIPIKYDKIVNYFKDDGLAVVKLNDKWGCIDKTGNVVIPLKYDLLSSMDGFKDGLFGLKSSRLGSRNQEAFPINGYKEAGLAFVKLNNKYGGIDKTGNVVIPLKYDEMTRFKNGLATVKLNDKWGCIDRLGNVIIPLKYDAIPDGFQGSEAMVKLNLKWGYIDKNDNWVKDAIGK